MAFATVAVLLGLVHAAAPDAARREAWTYGVALPLGYGHLIGAALASRVRRSARGLRGRAASAFWGIGVLALFAGYTRALQTLEVALVLVPVLLIVSAWHILENDLALEQARRTGASLPRIRTSAGDWIGIGTGILALASLALVTPSGRQALLLAVGWAPPVVTGATLADLAAAVLLYHAVSFLLFSLQRARGPGGARRRRILLLSHAVPALLNLLLACWMDALHAIVASPAFYLYWSVVHAIDTGLRRGGRGRGPRDSR